MYFSGEYSVETIKKPLSDTFIEIMVEENHLRSLKMYMCFMEAGHQSR
jgi:hypothetical protein